MAETSTRRQRARRLRSETDNAIREMSEEFVKAGWCDLVMYGKITFVVVNHQLKQVYLEPSFTPGVQTPDAA